MGHVKVVCLNVGLIRRRRLHGGSKVDDVEIGGELEGRSSMGREGPVGGGVGWVVGEKE